MFLPDLYAGKQWYIWWCVRACKHASVQACVHECGCKCVGVHTSMLTEIEPPVKIACFIVSSTACKKSNIQRSGRTAHEVGCNMRGMQHARHVTRRRWGSCRSQHLGLMRHNYPGQSMTICICHEYTGHNYTGHNSNIPRRWESCRSQHLEP